MRPSSLLTGVIFSLALMTSFASSANNLARQETQQQIHQYQVTIDSKLEKASVNLCFDGQAPEYLAVDNKEAIESLVGFPSVNHGHIEFQGRYWKTGKLEKNACIQYQADISRFLRQPDTEQQNRAKLSFQNENSWLWLPENLADSEVVQISFELPQNYRVSAPWLLLDNSGRRFEIGKAPLEWGFRLLIGEFETVLLSLPKHIHGKSNAIHSSQLNVAILAEAGHKQVLLPWVEDNAKALINYLGYYPARQTQVLLMENERFKKGAVPWGMVSRGGGTALHFVINGGRSTEDFYQSWTAPHVFSHLLLPQLESDDLWLAEGLASYLQYVLMAQSGWLTEQQLWQKLFSGFERGQQGVEKLQTETLRETCNKRREGNRHARMMRIYWSGAAYFMLADWQLRLRSNGLEGLPQVLAKFNQSCSNSAEQWSGGRLTQKLDAISASKIFSSLYQQLGAADRFPDYRAAFTEMGIRVSDGEVSFAPNDKTKLRKAIIQNRK